LQVQLDFGDQILDRCLLIGLYVALRSEVSDASPGDPGEGKDCPPQREHEQRDQSDCARYDTVEVDAAVIDTALRRLLRQASAWILQRGQLRLLFFDRAAAKSRSSSSS
jgi:hypothetical protein